MNFNLIFLGPALFTKWYIRIYNSEKIQIHNLGTSWFEITRRILMEFGTQL